MDELGNVTVCIRGAQRAPGLLVSAHTDTVFPLETDLAVRRQPGDERIFGPGIGDNSLGVAALLWLGEQLRDLPGAARGYLAGGQRGRRGERRPAGHAGRRRPAGRCAGRGGRHRGHGVGARRESCAGIPALSAACHGARRPQLDRLRQRERRPRVGAACGRSHPFEGAGAAAHHVQHRRDPGRHLGEHHRPGGGAGAGPAQRESEDAGKPGRPGLGGYAPLPDRALDRTPASRSRSRPSATGRAAPLRTTTRWCRRRCGRWRPYR